MSEFILEVVEGPDAGKRVVVDKPIVVGRDPEAGFVLTDREVSRRHLQLTPTGDYITVEDLDSANGTFVNHNELHGPARLDAGDELLAGVTVMQVRDRQQVEARHSAVIDVPQALAMAPRTPAYADPQKVTADVHTEGRGIPELEKFLDVKVRRRAVNAPWLLAVLVAGVLAAYFATRTTNTALASGPVAGWIYVDANTPIPNQNAVVAIPYDVGGFPMQAQAKSYLTGGTGSPLVLPTGDSVGTTDGDHQVLLSTDHTLLFAVNQGSNSIAVFHVNSQTGALTPVAGSPFASFGIAPIGLGYANGTLVVANHGISAPFAPNPMPFQTSLGGPTVSLGGSPPGPSYLVSFKVSATGALTRVSNTSPDPDGLIDATVSPDGSTVVTSGLYPELVKGQPLPTFGPQLIREVTLSSTGALTQTNAVSFPASFTAGLAGHVPFFFPPPLYPVAFGLAFNPDPTKKFVYIDATLAGRVAVYNYSNPASLQLVSNTPNPQAGSCWMTISKDGRFLYNSDTGSQTVTVFSISPDGSTLKLKGSVPLKSKGSSDTLAIDPSGHFLYVIGKHDDADAPRPEGVLGNPLVPTTKIVPAPLPANYIDAYRLNPTTGMPSEIETIQIPVPASNMPYGIDVLPKG